MNGFDDPRPLKVSDESFIYFLSDGVPNPASSGIDNIGTGSNVSIAEWESLRVHATPANDISEVFAIGLGPGIARAPNEDSFPEPLASGVSALSPVSFPNDDGPDLNTFEDNVILLPNDNIQDLLDTLTEAIGKPSSIGGNVLTDDPSSSTGADASVSDGGYIKSITVNGITYNV